jgi:hypothetical protein
MNIKLDENIPEDAATIFMDAGYQVSTVLDEGLGGRADPDVAAVCKAECKSNSHLRYRRGYYAPKAEITKK